MAPVDISVITVTFNREGDLRRTLRSVMRQTGVAFEVIVADNGSSDGTPQMLQDEFPAVRVLPMGSNTGMRAHNAGICAARADVLFFLDNDMVLVEDDLLARVYSYFAANPQLGAAACRVWDVVRDRAGVSLRLSGNSPKHLAEGDEVLGYETSAFDGGGAGFRRSAVLEAGMGGRWDATNVKDSRVVVFMPVGLEHCRILGDSLETIAGEKAGVIKSGSDVVLMSTEPDVLKIVLKRCIKTSSRLFVFNEDFGIEKKKLCDGSFSVNISGPLFEEIILEEGSSTDFQLENLLAAAVASALFLKTPPSNFNDAVKKVARALQIPGRFEVISKNPLIVLDGGHNPQAISALVNELDNIRIDGEKFVIFAAFDDKDVASMLVHLARHADHFIFTTSKNKRSFTPGELLSIFEDLLAGDIIKQKADCLVYDDIATGLLEVLKLAGPADAVIVTGSISNIGPAKEFLHSAGVY